MQPPTQVYRMAYAGRLILCGLTIMARTWAKIHKQAINSDNLNRLLEEYPLAEALYWRLLATCTAYGRGAATPPRGIADARPAGPVPRRVAMWSTGGCCLLG